jgi:hypothetical protein
MRKLYASMFLLAFCFLVFAASNAAAQMVGNYRPVSKNDPQVKAAANYAVSTEATRTRHTITLISISKAEQQVVAGMNYRVCLKVREGKRTRWATAVVYRHWKGKRSLTSWDWGTCDW